MSAHSRVFIPPVYGIVDRPTVDKPQRAKTVSRRAPPSTSMAPLESMQTPSQRKLPKSNSAPNNLKAPRESRLKRLTSKLRSFPSSTSISGSNSSSKAKSRADSAHSEEVLSSHRPETREQPSIWKNEQYTQLLEKAVENLKNDYVSGARQMADKALYDLYSLIRAAAATAKSRDDLWKMTVHSAKALTDARPSMSAAISSCLLHALDALTIDWNQEKQEQYISTTEELANVAYFAINEMLQRRKEAGINLGENFVRYLKDLAAEGHETEGLGHITVLTLSNSSTIRTCILTALSSLTDLSLRLYIMESRPHFEGADMAAQILSSTPADSKHRLRIHILPDCAVATMARDADLVLLGADRISSKGDVSNKIGSFAAALSIKQGAVPGQVVVVSDEDKIVAPNAEEGEKETHAPIEMMGAWKDETRRDLGERIRTGNVEIFGEWFEWVPAEYVDLYITETGVLDTRGVEKAGRETGKLKKKIFGS